MLALVAGLAGALAAETPASEASLAGAKRDFDASKQAAATPDPAKLSLPRRELPTVEFHALEPVPVRVRTATDRDGDGKPDKTRNASGAKTSGNWLVDAMTERAADGEKRSEQGTDEPQAFDAEAGVERDFVAQPLAPAGQRPAKHGGPDERDAAVSAQTMPNPLDAFMASWMTPRDFQLLQPADGTAAAAFGLGNSPAGSVSLSAESGGRAARADSSLLNSPLGDGPGDAAANPYLADARASFGLGEQSLAGPPMAAAIPLVSPPRTPIPPPTTSSAPEPPKSERPAEALRGADDARYFKQLKRF